MSMNDMQVGRAKQHHVTQLLRCSLIEIQADFSPVLPTALPALHFSGKMGCFCNDLRINFATCGQRVACFGAYFVFVSAANFLGLYVRNTFKLVYQVNAFKF